MRNLFDQPTDACPCKRNGVIVDAQGVFQFCACPYGVSEQIHNRSGYAEFIGRRASDVESELQSQLKEQGLAS